MVVVKAGRPSVGRVTRVRGPTVSGMTGETAERAGAMADVDCSHVPVAATEGRAESGSVR